MISPLFRFYETDEQRIDRLLKIGTARECLIEAKYWLKFYQQEENADLEAVDTALSLSNWSQAINAYWKALVDGKSREQATTEAVDIALSLPEPFATNWYERFAPSLEQLLYEAELNERHLQAVNTMVAMMYHQGATITVALRQQVAVELLALMSQTMSISGGALTVERRTP